MTMATEIERLSQIDNGQQEAWREIGQCLQTARSRLDEPFAVVATKAAMKPTDLAAIERGEIRLNRKELQSLLTALKISHVDFVVDLSLEARMMVMELVKPEPEVPVPVVESHTDGVSLSAEASLSQNGSRAGVRAKRSPNGWGVAREQGQISYYQMHAYLRGMFKRTDREKAEIIYSWSSTADMNVKVFTSIDARTGLARPVGEDAIRIVVYDQRARRKIVSWSMDLKRTASWRMRLLEKAGAAILRASYRPHCPACRQDTMIIYGQPEAQFWGCSHYPECRGTSNTMSEP